jgi:putative endonuclease
MTQTPGGWVYILTNRPNGTLYIGVTNDLMRRIHEHRSGSASMFTRRYYLRKLVYFEHHDAIQTAIQRETSVKRWPRAWKVNLITGENPEWTDLFGQLLQ